MVVDDHAASAALLAELLSLEGYAVEVAYCGKDALAIAREFHPRIALLDIGLPDINGFDLLRLFRTDPQLKQVRVVAVSGYAQPAGMTHADPQGFDEHLIKPIDVEHLLTVLRQLL
jgi:CheY-like chemotaxis protein